MTDGKNWERVLVILPDEDTLMNSPCINLIAKIVLYIVISHSGLLKRFRVN